MRQQTANTLTSKSLEHARTHAHKQQNTKMLPAKASSAIAGTKQHHYYLQEKLSI
jgi:hypothetical protein